MGHATGVTQTLADDTYAPLYIEATLPSGAYLNWSVLNTAGEVIPGMEGSNNLIVPLNMLDHHVVDEFRLHLELSGGANGMPLVHSVSGDGSVRESFYTDPVDRGWELNGSTYSASSVSGGANDTLVSPWMLANAPVYDAKLTGSMTNAQAQIRYHPDHAWTNITLPFTPVVSQEVVGMQGRFVALPPADGNMSNFTSWSVDSIALDLFGGQHPVQPALDFKLDERYEWGGEDARVGAWGWQDRFANAQEQMEVSLTGGSPSVATLWAPQQGLSSFGFSYAVESGSVQDVALFVQNNLIANRSAADTSNGLFHLTPEELSAMVNALGNVANTVDILGTPFTEVSIELTGTGSAVLGGLRATYNASHHLVAEASSDFVMGVNEARTSVPNVGGMQAIPLPFMAAERGGLTVEVIDLQTSSSVLLQDGEMVNAPYVLTPSQHWQTISAEYQITGGSPAHYRLDVFSKVHQATWLFPAAGGAPAGLGDADLVELHPTDPITVTEDGLTVISNITFRLRPLWDDEMQLTATSRVVMQNSVISIPFLHTWGTVNTQGYENDLELKAIVFSEDGVPMPSSRQYLRGGESMDISVKVGFEGLNTPDAFVDGDAKLTLYRDGNFVRNTTQLDGTYWNFTETIPFTYGDVMWTVQLEPLNGSSIV